MRNVMLGTTPDNTPKSTKMKTSKIRKSARNQQCQVRIPGICNFNPETTVLAHVNGGGMGRKSPDLLASFCCSACHDVIDGRNRQHNYSANAILIMFYEGVFRTQRLLLDQGLIQTPGSVK